MTEATLKLVISTNEKAIVRAEEQTNRQKRQSLELDNVLAEIDV